MDAFDLDGVGERVTVSIWDDVKDDLTDHFKADLWRILGVAINDGQWAPAEQSIGEGYNEDA